MKSQKKESSKTMDKNTAEKLYEAFYMKVFSYVMTLTNNQDEAMEITQETFFRAISTDKEFRGESKSYTWLCAIAKNLFIDEKRRHSKVEQVPLEDQPDANESIESKLTDADTTIRIGSIFAKTETWARVKYHRARIMIKERMEES